MSLRLIVAITFANPYGSIICIRLNGYNLSQNQQVQHPSFCSNERLSAAKIDIIINISHTERLIMIILGLIFIKPNILKTNIT